ncbi:hypothetical protein Acor_67070 [Acrocarpospora corrugata]|uniref:Uncharacterized protein n=1 Tax=Acrocarpospora corrugata TaxID=35763 RepID=A0A5M3W8H6_9ACTN|nr:hypothetical protein [Acrocarpospora corrugata]GES04639.1 hypothetical protein Acor_67070 [Acrocarpospora corrugata]
MTSPVSLTNAAAVEQQTRPPRSAVPQWRELPWEHEYGRDVWRLRELGIRDREIANLHFTDIPQPWLKDLAKRWLPQP